MSLSCLLCSGFVQQDLTLKDLFSFKPVSFPVICRNCKDSFTYLNQKTNSCQACQKNLPEDRTHCSDCLAWLETYPEEIVSNRSIFTYNSTFQDWLHKYKTQADARLAQVMRAPLRKIKKDYPDYTWIVLPSSKTSIAQRGFNQNSLLLYEAGIDYQITFDYLSPEPKQAQLSRRDRIKAKVRFKLKEGVDLRQLGDKFLVFDDLYTTGSTIIKAKNLINEELKRTNKNNFQIKSLTLARAYIRK